MYVTHTWQTITIMEHQNPRNGTPILNSGPAPSSTAETSSEMKKRLQGRASVTAATLG